MKFEFEFELERNWQLEFQICKIKARPKFEWQLKPQKEKYEFGIIVSINMVVDEMVAFVGYKTTKEATEAARR